MSLVERACEELPRLGESARIAAIHVRIGPLAGIVKEALQFSFDVAAAGSPVEGARLEIEDVPISVFCRRCTAKRQLDRPEELRCPVCGTSTPDVVTGRELEVKALEVVDDAPDRGSSSEHPQEE
jgi:hydrogenase nickel incorporation protein HypA/HybF